MENLKELIEKVYKDLKNSDWIIQYPQLSEKIVLSEYIQELALDMLPGFVPNDKREEFVDACEKCFKESTFKSYVENYSDYLDNVEQEFYNGLLSGLTEN